MHRICGLGVSLTLLCVAVAQTSGTRVGVTAAGNNLIVRRQVPCGTPIGTLSSGVGGVVLGSSQFCEGHYRLPTRWPNGWEGWTAIGTGGTSYLVTLAGRSVFPNVTAPEAYLVRVGPDATSLNVRTGPGTQFGVITSKPAGSVGWAFEVHNNTSSNTVWWKIRWSDGVIGWSAESMLGAGVYLTMVQMQTKTTLNLQASGTSGVSVQVSPADLNIGAPNVTLPATLVYLSGGSVSLTAPEIAFDGARFVRWEVNGTSYSTRTISLRLLSSQVFNLRVVYSGSPPTDENQFLSGLVAPWPAGQLYQPSTYDGHTRSGVEFAVDFNRASGARSTCNYVTGWLEDCNQPMLASHRGRVFNRGNCGGYGNYVVVVSSVRPSGTPENTFYATLYAHLNYFLQQNGTVVEAGTPIGRLGSTGYSTGPHLHYELRHATLSGSTLTLGTLVRILNNPRIRLSGQPLQVDFNCRVQGLGYVGSPISGTVALGNVPANIQPPCAPYNCPGGITDELEDIPDYSPSRSEAEIPLTLTLYLSDVDGSGCVDETDLLQLLQHFGQTWNGGEDINWDGIVDDVDLLLLLQDIGRGCGTEQ